MAGTVCQMGIIMRKQRRKRTSLDVWRLELFERLLRISFIFVGISFDLGLELGGESLVLLSSSNAASLVNFDVVGEEVKRDKFCWERSV